MLAWVGRTTRRTGWSVAFSGGADSLAALLLAWAHWPDRRDRLRALHFDHRLRGADSRADAAFCRQVARSLGVKAVSAAWRNPPAGASEADARAARMAFLHAEARVIWFGHHMDDVAESLLMRLGRGSGTGGLAAPRPVQRATGGRVHLRPLLALRKAEIVEALESAGAEWREDRTNAGGSFLRNRVRLHVLPAWQQASGRDAVAGAARSRMLLEEDDAALEAWLDEIKPWRKPRQLDLDVLRGKPRGLLRRALHRWLLDQPEAGKISRRAFDALLASLELGKRTRHSLGRHGFAVLDGRTLRFQRA